MTFPANFPVDYEEWFSRGKDGLQNDIDGWRDPAQRWVIGWTFKRTLDQDGIHQVLDENRVRLQVPSDFVWSPLDLITLPDVGKFQVSGLDEATNGFHGWKPAFTLKLLRVEGG